MLSALLLPILRERFPNRGLVEGTAPEPIAVFKGIHPAIDRLAIYDDRQELTVSIEPLMHGHFSEYDATLSKKERERRIVESVVDFLDAVFADQLAVSSKGNSAGWCRIDRAPTTREPDVQEYDWSGPRRYDAALNEHPFSDASCVGYRYGGYFFSSSSKCTSTDSAKRCG